MKPSPYAASALIAAVSENLVDDAEELMGMTDCPDGCVVEPDGHCSHGYESAGLTAGVI